MAGIREQRRLGRLGEQLKERIAPLISKVRRFKKYLPQKLAHAALFLADIKERHASIPPDVEHTRASP
jgi:hypothetical protein